LILDFGFSEIKVLFILSVSRNSQRHTPISLDQPGSGNPKSKIAKGVFDVRYSSRYPGY
jgi:hypothetical protein